jgi:DNA-binding beta-propeller fold protein YncE
MPTLTQVISDDRRQVVDVTSIESRLFVLRHPSKQQIQVYDTKTFKQQGALQVKDLSDDTINSGLTSCVSQKCVYVSDYYKNTVYKVTRLGRFKKVFSWRVDGRPSGLSINIACNLLVACGRANKIVEYTTSGSLVREISFKSNDVELHPYHAIQLTSDQFVVSCWNQTHSVHDVVEVDTKGRVVVSYINQLQSNTQCKFNVPLRLSVDKNNELILVADSGNNRIVILNRSLNCCARVMSADGGLQGPSCLHFDTSQNRLIVGDWIGRALVFDNVI